MTPTDPDNALWKIIEAREATIRNLTQQLTHTSPRTPAPEAPAGGGSTLVPSGAMMHSQEVELELLNRLIPNLQSRTFLDIGAEQGSLSRFFITAGLTGHLFEPFAQHEATLKALVAGTPSVFHPIAIDDQDRRAELQIATDPEGNAIPEFNSLHKLTHDDLRISQQTIQPVECRSLRSLVAAGAIPPAVGLVKTDTEGNDAAVLRGMPVNYCEAVCCEYFTEGLYAGWDQSHPRVILELARQLGFEHYIVTKRRAGMTGLAIGPTTCAPLTWGNYIFVRAELWTACLPLWLELVKKCDAATGAAYETMSAECASLRHTNDERLGLIRQLNETSGELRQKLADVHAASQLQQTELLAKESVIQELKRDCDERDAMIKQIWSGKANRLRNPDGTQLFPSVLRQRWDRFRHNWFKKLASTTPHKLGQLVQHEPRPVRFDRFPRPSPRPNWPRICLVTPSYQQAQFLERTMRSVLDQHYPKLAYGVQDGGSTDGSAELITGYVPRLAHAESAPDGGQAAAIVRGFGKLYPENDDIMGWLNSDDVLAPGSLALIGDYFSRHPEVDVVYGHRIIIDDEDREVGRWYLPRHHDQTLRWVDFVPQETLFWRARCYNEIEGVDPSFHFAMDWDLLLRFERAGCNIVRLPWFLGCFRVHAHQKTSAKIETLGEEEMRRLRRRVHGEDLKHWEILKHHDEEVRRSAFIAWLHRFGVRY